MKTILLPQVPKNVIRYINEMKLDFATYLKMANPPKEQREQIKTIVDNLNKLLTTQEWKINHFGILVDHFYDSKIKNTKLLKSNPLAGQILKECDVVLNYCEQEFDITYFPDGQFLISQKIGKVG